MNIHDTTHSTRSTIPNCCRMKLDGQQKILKCVVWFACVEVTRSSNLICCFCISQNITHRPLVLLSMQSAAALQELHLPPMMHILTPLNGLNVPRNCITFPCKVRSDLPIYWARASLKYPMIKLYATLGRDMCTDGISNLPWEASGKTAVWMSQQLCMSIRLNKSFWLVWQFPVFQAAA